MSATGEDAEMNGGTSAQVGDVGACPFCGGAIITTAGPHYCLARDVVARISTSDSPTPDTSPRCPSCTGPLVWLCVVCGTSSEGGPPEDENEPQARPAPTPSGDDALAAFNEKMWGLGPTDEVEAEAISEFATAIRAESAAALLEARERLTAAESLSRKGHRALAAAEAWNVEAERTLKDERERRKVAEERLREVEDELDRLRDAVVAELERAIAGARFRGEAQVIAALEYVLRADCLAASRPVPAVTDYGTTVTRGERRDDAVMTSSAPAATPSTDEEGRA